MSLVQQQLEFLRRQYKLGGDAKTILDNFANRKNHLSISKVSTIATQCSLSEEAVKTFFKALAEEQFGRFVKSSKGHPARFEWGTEEAGFGVDYSLIATGRAAQNLTDNLDIYSTDVEGDDDEVSGMVVLPFPLPKGRSLEVHCPPDLSVEELESIFPLLKMHISALSKI